MPSIHDQAKPLNVLKGIHRTLKADGVYLMQDIRGSSHVYNDIGHPIGPFLYAISTMHCMTVSLAQGGEGLGAMWGEERTREYLRRRVSAPFKRNNWLTTLRTTGMWSGSEARVRFGQVNGPQLGGQWGLVPLPVFKTGGRPVGLRCVRFARPSAKTHRDRLEPEFLTSSLFAFSAVKRSDGGLPKCTILLALGSTDDRSLNYTRIAFDHSQEDSRRSIRYGATLLPLLNRSS